MKLKYICFFSSFLFLLESQSQNNIIHSPDGKEYTIAAINHMILKLMDTAEVPGLCLAIIENNHPAYIKAYGYKNKMLGLLNDTSTCFYAASWAKPLFAYLVMQLVDEGKLDLDKPLYKYLSKPLPDFVAYHDLAGDERWKLITARHCLDHTTGFPNWRFLNPHENNKLEIFFTPGSRYAYSGEGLYLLQMVIEHITGRQLEDLAQEKIFRPFGMIRTSFIWQPSFESNYAWGHDMNSDTLPMHRRTSSNAAGSMETTIADYSRFVSAVMQGKRLSAHSRKEMFSPQIMINSIQQFPSLRDDTTSEYRAIGLSYGLGWGLFNSNYGKAFFKEGHDDGWVNYMISFPDKKYALLIMCNSSNGESIFKELVEDLTGITIPWKWEGYTPYRTTIKLSEEELHQYTGTYDGKLKAVITLENGQLKVTSETVHLSKTNLYPFSADHFFMKVMDTELEFVRDKDGKVAFINANDEGEHYQLKKIQ